MIDKTPFPDLRPFDVELREVLLKLDFKGIKLPDLVNLSPRDPVTNAPLLSVQAIGHWQQYQDPTNISLRVFIRTLDTLTEPPNAVLEHADVERVIASRKTTRPYLFATCHNYIAEITEDDRTNVPTGALLYAIRTAYGMEFSRKELQAHMPPKMLVTRAESSNQDVAPDMTRAYLEACNKAGQIKKDPAFTPLTPDEIEKVVALSQRTHDYYQVEYGRRAHTTKNREIEQMSKKWNDAHRLKGIGNAREI